MTSNLAIFNKILFGDLRPNIEGFENDEAFRHFLLPEFTNPQGSVNQYKKNLNKVLKQLIPNINTSIDIFEYETNSYFELPNPGTFSDPLIKVLNPGYLNSKSHFYYYLIQSTSFIVFHDLVYEVVTNSTTNSKKHALNSIFKEIKYLVTETNKLIISPKQIQLTDNQFDINTCKSDTYVLTTLIKFLTKLYIEIILIFPELTTSEPFEFNSFFIRTFNFQPPEEPFNFNYVNLFSFLIKRFIDHQEYKYDKAIEYIDNCKVELSKLSELQITMQELEQYKTELIGLIQLLENLIFLKDLNHPDFTTDYDNLINPEFCKSAFNSLTTTILANIIEEFNPILKLEMVISYTEKLKFIDSKNKIHPRIEINSIPGKIKSWLKHQEEFYKSNQHIDFSKLKNNNLSKIPTSLNVGELALIFRLFVEEKILNPKTKMDLFKAISIVFESKKSSELSQNSIKNKFDTPEFNALDYWDTKLVDLRSQNRKLKEK